MMGKVFTRKIVLAVVFFLAWTQEGFALKTEEPSSHIEIFKAKRQLVVYDGNNVVKSYRIGLGLNPIGPKKIQGDRATPEGTYTITHKNQQSKFYLSLGISYPGVSDAERGLKDKIISQQEYKNILTAIAEKKTPPSGTRLGGEIFIHGKGSQRDWTWGCIALDNADMLELFNTISVGTSVTIHP